MLYNYNYFSSITICYEALLELHVYFVLTNYDVIQTIIF